ncbi:hypothetical protein [Mycolicibacterium sp.]|uniref:hypothetical protein n=1 Tax=Mycolicibacterium sp. TaxID=2320850 RepID=UPI0025F3228D|nr:hypothetical protein [Mycolicibacterium sp.]MCB9409825.1 hypothetical protein [Mycolicibacterium sp.]
MSTSSLLAPGVALAVALGPAVVAPPAPSDPLPRVVLPSVHIEEIQLAGIGQDIYYAITPYVQYAVGGVSYLINFIPLIGGPIAAQININYFQGVQPIVEATVNYLAAVVQDPFNFPAATGAYGRQLYGIGYNWVDAELQFFGLPPLAPLAPAASVGGVGRPDRVAAASAAAVRPEVATPVAVDETALLPVGDDAAGPAVDVPAVDVSAVAAGADGGAANARERAGDGGVARQRGRSAGSANRSEAAGERASARASRASA